MDSATDTSKTSSSVLDKNPGNKPTKPDFGNNPGPRNFLPPNSIPAEQADSPEAEATPTPKKKAAPEPKPAKRKKKEPAPVRVPWATRMRPALIEEFDAYMATLPRHVTQQDIIEHIVADFLARKPDLPDSLLNPAPPAR